MKKTLTKILSVILIVCITLTSAPLSGLVGLELPEWLDFSITSKAATTYGTFGDNLTWNYSTSTNTLTISGNGEMGECYRQPWEEYRYDIKKVIIKSGVTTVGKGAFHSCHNLKNVTIGKDVTLIDYSAFGCCYALTSINIPNSVISIGNSAFAYCDNLKKVTLGSGLSIIDNFAFLACCNLENIILPEGLSEIGNDAFQGCQSFTNIIIPKNVMSIGNSAFSGCDSLESITVDSNNLYYSNDEYGVLFDKNKTTLIQYPIGNTRTTYSIPDGVIVIGDDSFKYCKNLENIKIFDTVTTIGDSSFSQCENLSSIILPNSVSTIGDEAFWFCTSLTSIVIPDSVTTIGEYAFYCCSNIVNITVGISLKMIGIDAFLGCSNLKRIDVDDNNVFYSSDEFGVLFDKNKTSIIHFPICNTVNNYTLPNSVISICQNAFSGCSNLVEIILPNTVKIIGKGAFSGCSSLTNITIPNNIEIIDDYVFSNCTSLINVIIPSSVISIGNYAFGWCSNLISVTLTNSVKTINEGAFWDCLSLFDVYYSESQKEWYKISIDKCNDSFECATIHYNYCDHHYELITYPPTCTSQGYTTYTCSICGDTYKSDYVDALGHTDGDIVEENYVAPTCTKNGSKDNVTYCTVCNTEISREAVTIPTLGHDIITDEAVAPDCTNTGLTAGEHCARCDYKVEQTVVDALGHDIINDEAIAPDCTNTGLTAGEHCSRCDYKVEQTVVDALGHDIITDEAVAPDCTNTGLTAGEHCSRCDYKVEQTVVDVLGHKYDSVITAPTCTTQGYTTYTCHCGDTYTGDYVDALSHNYKDGICTDGEAPDPLYFTFEIQQPSRTTIRCNDGIKLHTKITGNLPDGTRIEWSKNNNNFNMTTSAGGNEITIISKNNGYTTFTATVYDADNNVIAQDTIEMYSKAGLFDKIGGFFRSLFGSTKIHEN